MKFIRYFFYLALNWNIRIAVHILKQELRGEKKYGINSTGADDLQGLEKAGIDISHATVYMPASYDLLELLFKKINLPEVKHFIDLGCGKGRALCVAAAMGAKKLTGVEFSKDLYLDAKRNAEKIKQEFPASSIQLFNNDAFWFEIKADVDCIFMFNPFDDLIMSGVLENIEDSLQKYPRPLTVIYINPLQKHLFAAKDYKEVFHFQEKKYLEGSIFIKENR